MSEQISALMDDELDADAAERLIAALADDPASAERWGAYHLIGDALRGTQPASMDVRRLSARIAAEPTVVAPRARPVAVPARPARPRVALSLAAGIAAVAFVGWVAAPMFDSPSEAPVALKAEAAAVAAARPAVIPAAHGVEDYLLAHQRFSPTFVMQGAVPYVRMVSEEGRERMR